MKLIESRNKNAIILAAGFSSRFAPLSYEKPKALIEVKGEILIERQIEQLIEAGVNDITIVVGYKHEMFEYLKEKYPLTIVLNDEYSTKNNISSMFRVKDKIKNTYICSADNYFKENVFIEEDVQAYYSAIYVKGMTDEWCLKTDLNYNIIDVTIGGHDAWIMIGHAYFSEEFSKKYIPLLIETYHQEGNESLLWEHLYIRHLNELTMKMKKYPKNVIHEFDSLDELREFDGSYRFDSKSKIMRQICDALQCNEYEIISIKPISSIGEIGGFTFNANNVSYRYNYSKCNIREM